MPGRYDAEMGLADSLHSSAYCSEYNERCGLICFAIPNNKKCRLEFLTFEKFRNFLLMAAALQREIGGLEKAVRALHRRT